MTGALILGSVAFVFGVLELLFPQQMIDTWRGDDGDIGNPWLSILVDHDRGPMIVRIMGAILIMFGLIVFSEAI